VLNELTMPTFGSRPNGSHEQYTDRRACLDEPRPAPLLNPPPMTPAGRAIWDEFTPDLVDKGVMRSRDGLLFGELCDLAASARVLRVRAFQEPSGELVVRPGAPSPFTQWRAVLGLLMGMGGRFGLTPADRARLGDVDGRLSGPNDDLLSG
jgi:hypothetical protein